MRIKSYFAETVADAVRAARREMGEDAMLVESRKAPVESQHLGNYEVVFALGATESAPSGPTLKGGAPPLAAADMTRLSSEMEQMRRQLESIRCAMRSNVSAPRWIEPSSALAGVFSALLDAEISGEVAQAIAAGLHARLDPAAAQDQAALAAALADELEKCFTVDPSLGKGDAAPRVAALVGPPGSGKTSTLVKLAVAQGLAARKSVQLLSLDNVRVAAGEQLRSYAAILGVGFQALDSPVALAQALHDHRSKSLILIDTPGFSPAEMDGASELAHALRARPEIDVHLVLSASMRTADLTRVVEAFEIVRPAKLLFTRLDETTSFGAVLSESARAKKPLSFLATGQRIPEDLVAAGRKLLIDLILRDPLARERQAA